jgi:protein-glutamine gamma-glutamyltransferase
LEQSRQMQFFFLVAAVASIFIVEIWKWTAIPSWAANLLALVAMISCARKFLGSGQAYQLPAVADLLLYLQLILFFQQKAIRIYWVLLVLGLLRVVVASTTEPEAYFAPFLLLFVVSAISTLTCFYLWREEDRLKTINAENGRDKTTLPTINRQSENAALSIAKRLVASATQVAFVRSTSIGTKTLFWSIARESFRITIMTLVLAAIFFAVMPRLGENGWVMAKVGQTLTGFSPEVRLQSIATLQQNPDPVFRVTLRNAFSNQPIETEQPLYIQGNVLRYYGRSGGGTSFSWRRNDPGAAPYPELTALPTAPTREALVRQHFTLDMPIRSNGTLFAIYPVYSTSTTPNNMRLLDKGNHLQGTGPTGFEYTLLTNSFVEGQQNVLRPIDYREDPAYHDTTTIEPTRFPGLMKKCDAIIKASPNATANRVSMAQALTAHLQSSGEYVYSVDRSGIRIANGVDPIEEFVTTSKKGYCQFFASALAVMLRYREIPCRLVNGYCTNEYNELGEYYQVRQYHAHVWVEVFVTQDDLATMGPAYKEKYPRGAWMRFDPTPEAGLPAFQSSNTSVASNSINFAQILWRDYVVGMNPRRQQEAIYDPLKSTMLESVRNIFSLNAWKEWLQRLRQLEGIREFLSGNWFNWRGGLAAMSFCAGLYLLLHFVRWFSSAAREYLNRARSIREIARSRSNVEFYDRFEAILKKLGLVRAIGQTPREFAFEISTRFEEAPDLAWKDSANDFIELYYQVRFGESTLDGERLSRVEKLLDSLTRLTSPAVGKAPS